MPYPFHKLTSFQYVALNYCTRQGLPLWIQKYLHPDCYAGLQELIEEGLVESAGPEPGVWFTSAYGREILMRDDTERMQLIERRGEA